MRVKIGDIYKTLCRVNRLREKALQEKKSYGDFLVASSLLTKTLEECKIEIELPSDAQAVLAGVTVAELNLCLKGIHI